MPTTDDPLLPPELRLSQLEDLVALIGAAVQVALVLHEPEPDKPTLLRLRDQVSALSARIQSRPNG